MKLLQFHLPQEGLRVGLLRDNQVWDVTAWDHRLNSLLKLFGMANRQKTSTSLLLGELLESNIPASYDFDTLGIFPDTGKPHLAIPITPPEVWAFGVTYQRSAQVRDEDTKELGIYDRVYSSPRPECFFKATPSRCVGPHDYICCRSDSELTAPEPELAYILGDNKEILGYTICNDVSAWDIERENPLYLPQSKIYNGCCALGPVVVTADELTGPMNLEINCRVIRDREVIFEGSTNSSRIGRSFEELNNCLYLHNTIPFGTAVSTGTGIMVPNEQHLKEGDSVEIEIENIGKLVNPVKQL